MLSLKSSNNGRVRGSILNRLRFGDGERSSFRDGFRFGCDNLIYGRFILHRNSNGNLKVLLSELHFGNTNRSHIIGRYRLRFSHDGSFIYHRFLFHKRKICSSNDLLRNRFDLGRIPFLDRNVFFDSIRRKIHS